MYPLNDKDLDRLSREAAEQFDVEPSASGWEHLEQRLNKEIPVKDEKDRRRFLLWIFLLALLSGGGLLGMLSTYNNDSVAGKTTVPANQQAAGATSSTTKAEPDGTTSSPITGHEEPSVIKEATGTGNDLTKTTDKKSAPDKSAIVQSETPADAVSPSVSTGNKPAVTQKETVQKQTVIRKELAKTNKEKLTIAPAIVPSGRTGKKTGQQPIKDKTGIAVNNRKNNSANQKEKPAPTENIKDESQPIADVTSPAKKNEETVTAPATPGNPDNTTTAGQQADTKKEEELKKEEPVTVKKKEPVKKTKTKVTQPLEFGVLAGPDFTRVNFGQGDKAGFNLGVQVAYRFANRWSVNSGLVYTKKNYTALGEDFNSPKHTWISYVDLHKVQGYCSMLEIPVNIRYDLSSNKQKRFFVSTGLSSYLMNKEYYDYYFTYQGVDRKQEWQRDSTINYMASVLNLSAGYERAIGKNFSVQAEPYFRIPLKGLGYGTMNLDSYGIYFTLKYKPTFSKKIKK